MPIKVTCQCGKSFTAKDELAGKAVKCPNCQQPLRIPATSSGAPAAAKPAPAARPAAPQPVQPAPSGQSDVFDDIGLKLQSEGTRPCPGCGEALPPTAVVCIKCGYNMKLGRRMETVKVGEAGGGGGHSGLTADLMEKAAQSMETDVAEEQKKTREGVPWWVYLVGLVVLSGFLATMVVIANRNEGKDKDKDKKGAVERPSKVLLADVNPRIKPTTLS
jgi:ssDNA-binding Zn-finger/Zn-ribbon topoisomerase 1